MARARVTIIVPALNEQDNIPRLLQRIDDTLTRADIAYQVIVIDDRSSDATYDVTMQLASRYPVTAYRKVGSAGKALSLLEGFAYTTTSIVAMIDADLQYPPEALPAMIDKIIRSEADIVVADRSKSNTTWFRRVQSRIFGLIFARWLHGLTCDVQSGLKVFRTKITHEFSIHPTPWTFDMEFLLKARQLGYTISSVPIYFDSRTAGESKIRFFNSVIEIGWNALKLKFKLRHPLHLKPHRPSDMIGAGIAHRGNKYITHTTLHHSSSAVVSFNGWQKICISVIIALIITWFVVNPARAAVGVVAVLSVIYFIDMIFAWYVVRRSLKRIPELHATPDDINALRDEQLPVYTVLCPLYKESHVLPGFVSSIQALDWPKNKLDVLLLLEENDPETITAAQNMQLPGYFRILVVPHSLPKTKPKACNYGLGIATGEYLVIYDAEDVPDPHQLKKAYLGFQQVDRSVYCLQAKLNYYNPHQNLLTRFFTAEYSLWFDVTLPGLQSLGTYIPLGGTSNHFRTDDLRRLEGWDPFNVTEDCDLGIRLFKRGYRTAIIDSVTLEEANSSPKNWLRQRSRWIKGYMQTYLVHMRNPIKFFRTNGWHGLIFQLVIGSKTIFPLINPILWLITILYFSLHATLGPAIERVFPPPVYVMAATSMVFGNFMFMFYYMIGCAKREQWLLMKYVWFVPIYWLLASVAAYRALYQLVIKPHYWEKTVHGLHLARPHIAPASTSVAPSITRRRLGYYARMLAYRLVPVSLRLRLRSSTSSFVVVLGISSGLNLLFNLILGNVLPLDQFSTVALVNTIWHVASIFITALALTVTHSVAQYQGNYPSQAGTAAFTDRVQKIALRASFVIALIWLVASPMLANFFQVHNAIILASISVMFITGTYAALGRGAAQGVWNFSRAGLIILIEALSKVLIGFLLAVIKPELAFAALPLSIILSAAAALGMLKSLRRDNARIDALPQPRVTFPYAFYTATVISSFAAIAFLSLDVLLAKHYLDASEAGQYALLSTIGKTIFFLSSLPSSALLSIASKKTDATSSVKIQTRLNLIIGGIVGLIACGFIVVGVFGPSLVQFAFGNKATSIVPFIQIYAISVTLFSVAFIYITLHLARKHYVFASLSALVPLSIAIGIFRYHSSMAQITNVVFIMSAVGLGMIVALHYVHALLPKLRLHLRDVLDSFGAGRIYHPVHHGRMSVLILNWRDIRHRNSGGAETYIHEIASRWVMEGHAVTIFCGNDGHHRPNDCIDGVNIIRRGGFYTVYAWAALYYVAKLRGKFDMIIDCHNGIPFFSPLFTRKRVVCLIHHVHQNVFQHSLPAFQAAIARFLERSLMPLVYRNVPCVTVSESSKQEISELGLGRAGIHVIHPGVDIHKLQPGPKDSLPTVLYLGRLKAYKSIDTLIKAFKKVKDSVPTAQLIIAGSGEESRALKRLAEKLRIATDVHFLGKVSERQKVDLLQQAWVFVNPSLMEGWGITTIEANACGTPVVASNVPGLRDSVMNPHTGYLVTYGDTTAFAERIKEMLTHHDMRTAMSKSARVWSGNFDWQTTSIKFLRVASMPYGTTMAPTRAGLQNSMIITNYENQNRVFKLR